MSARDDASSRLRAALADLAASDAETLIAEARAEARAQVKALVRDEMARALLQRAEELVAGRERRAEGEERPAGEPDSRASEQTDRESGPRPVPAQGWWLYCVADDGHPSPPAQLRGVDGAPPRVLRAHGLTAVLGPVPLDEFDAEGLKRNLNDLEWLEVMARAHETVLDAVLAGGTIVPMRVCTIYRDEDHVRTALAERRDEFKASLERLDGKAEWGVKAIAQAGAEGGADEASTTAAGAAHERGAGGAYFARKQHARAVREESERLLDEIAYESHARLEEWASASVLLPPQNRELSRHEGRMVFNAAYLVDRERDATFAGVVGELHAQYEEKGVSFELTGPWPAYHFAEEPLR